MILFIDTETTGFVRRDLPREDASQPRVVQFAALVCDESGDLVAQHVSLVRLPDKFEIPENVSAIHGITTEQANTYGISEGMALSLLDELVTSADLVVAHNIDFDCDVIGCMYARAGRKENAYGVAPRFCTMKATIPICKLPGRYGGDYKWPKLAEAHQHLFGYGFGDAHDALADVLACKRIYFELKSRNLLTPAV